MAGAEPFEAQNIIRGISEIGVAPAVNNNNNNNNNNLKLIYEGLMFYACPDYVITYRCVCRHKTILFRQTSLFLVLNSSISCLHEFHLMFSVWTKCYKNFKLLGTTYQVNILHT